MNNRRIKTRRIWNPLKEWDGIAYHHDGVTPVDLVKAAVLDAEMAAFDTLPKKMRNRFNEEGGIVLEYLQPPETTAGRR